MSRKQLAIHHLPEDIIIDVFNRLPFESIMALKSVSKEWKNVIDSTNYLDRYRHKLVTFTLHDDIYSVSVLRNSNDLLPTFTVSRIPFKPNIRDSLPGSKQNVIVRNGMACSYTADGEFSFYNIVTCATRNVRDAPLRDCLSNGCPWLCYGFGYDAFDDDDKMIVVCRNKHRPWIEKVVTDTVQNKDNGFFWVYRFKNLAWTRLQGFPYAKYDWSCLCYKRIGCSLNGVLHWIVAFKSSSMPVIVTYDVRGRRFGEMAVPRGDNGWNPQRKVNVMELGGELCCWKDDEEDISLWVMREYGVENSWTKLMSIGKDRWFNKMTQPVTQYKCSDGRRFVLLFCSRYRSLCWYNVYEEAVVTGRYVGRRFVLLLSLNFKISINGIWLVIY